MKSSSKIKNLSLDMPELNRILKKYVTLTLDAVSHFEGEERNKKNSLLNLTTSTFNKTYASLSQFSVTHDQKLYQTSCSSKEILEKNKTTHKELMNQLFMMEKTRYDTHFFQVSKEKQKYINCRKRMRELTRSLGNAYPHYLNSF